MTHIISNIYLGNLYDADDDDFLNNNKIKHIIRLTENDNVLTYAKTIKAYTFNISDIESEADRLYNLLPKIYNILKNIPKNENVLIHCNVGMSRSPTVVIYYIMKMGKINDYDKVLKFVKDKRSIVNPNVGFQKSLKENENNLL